MELARKNYNYINELLLKHQLISSNRIAVAPDTGIMIEFSNKEMLRHAEIDCMENGEICFAVWESGRPANVICTEPHGHVEHYIKNMKAFLEGAKIV